ncbi:Rieske (2Fe-2S) protein [Nocardia takedensis]
MTLEESFVSRRAVLGASCVLAGTAVGCGADLGADGPIESFTVPVGDVPVGGGTILADRSTVVTQPEPGVFRAFSTTCTHRGCAVTRIRAGRIMCPCHGSAFRVTDGSVADGPAERPLDSRPVTVTASGLVVG